MRFRRALYRAHRYLGAVLAVFLALAALTGAPLAFRGTIDAAINPDLFRVELRGEILDAPELAARVEAAEPHLTVTYLRLKVEPGRAVRMLVEPSVSVEWPAPEALGYHEIFVDPHDGRILGRRRLDGGPDRRRILALIHELHYSLLAGDRGGWVVGAVGLIALFQICFGLYLAFPRGPSRAAKLKSALLPNLTVASPRRWSALHKTAGLWAGAFLALTAFTGFGLALEQQVFAPMMSFVSKTTPDPLADRAAADAWATRLSIANAVTIAASGSAQLGLEPSAVAFRPDVSAYVVHLNSTSRLSYAGLGPGEIVIDGRDGRVLSLVRATEGSVSDIALRALYPIHSGAVGGTATRVLVSLVAVALFVLACTGPWLWWRKSAPPARSREEAGKL